jgi:hypothetical protein
MSKLKDIFVSEIYLISNILGLIPSMVMQLITKDEISSFSKNGGNPLGISIEDGPLMSKIHLTTLIPRPARHL